MSACWFLGSDPNFAAQRSEAPAGRAAGSGNLGSDPENARVLTPNPNPNLPPLPHPCGCAEERREKRIRDRDCLSAASSSGTPLFPSTAGCPQRSGGTQEPGSPFFSLGFFGEAKKSKSPAAATERHRNPATTLTHDSAQRFDTSARAALETGTGIFGVRAQIRQAFSSPYGCCAAKLGSDPKNHQRPCPGPGKAH